MVYFQKIAITGVANTTTYDDGLESSSENPKRLLSVISQVDAYRANDVQGWLEREKIFDLPDKLIDTEQLAGDNNFSKSFNRLNEIEVGHDLPVGTTFKVAIKCGENKTDFIGAYRFEIVK